MTTKVAVDGPPDQVKVLAPLAVRVAEFPEHRTVELGLIVKLGDEFTFKVKNFVVEQATEVPITEYTVVTVGDTAIVFEVEPVFHE